MKTIAIASHLLIHNAIKLDPGIMKGIVYSSYQNRFEKGDRVLFEEKIV